MKLKMIALMSVSALLLSGCGHFGQRGGCGCCKMEAKKECAGGECSMEKKCGDCNKTEEKSSK